MVALPERENSAKSLIDKWHEDNQEPPRFHMGASMLGHKCDRWLWLNFRWAVIEKFPGRILRLFRRGHHEENWIVDDLKSIGVDIHSFGGDQSRVDFGCHISGSIDGIIESGLPEAPKARHIAEFKTHSKKFFDDLCKRGVEKSKPVHFAQMQIYMFGKDIDRAFYVAVNKDDDSIYTERLRLDKELAQKLIERGKRLALSDRMPEPMPGASASWYECKFCAAYAFCHKGENTKEVNCRTCAHVTAREDSTFFCEKNQAVIPNNAQYGAYPCHTIHPDLVKWQMLDSLDEWTAVYNVDGEAIPNGENGVPSKAILNDVVQEIIKQFDVSEVKINAIT